MNHRLDSNLPGIIPMESFWAVMHALGAQQPKPAEMVTINYRRLARRVKEMGLPPTIPVNIVRVNNDSAGWWRLRDRAVFLNLQSIFDTARQRSQTAGTVNAWINVTLAHELCHARQQLEGRIVWRPALYWATQIAPWIGGVLVSWGLVTSFHLTWPLAWLLALIYPVGFAIGYFPSIAICNLLLSGLGHQREIETVEDEAFNFGNDALRHPAWQGIITLTPAGRDCLMFGSQRNFLHSKPAVLVMVRLLRGLLS